MYRPNWIIALWRLVVSNWSPNNNSEPSPATYSAQGHQPAGYTRRVHEAGRPMFPGRDAAPTSRSKTEDREELSASASSAILPMNKLVRRQSGLQSVAGASMLARRRGGAVLMSVIGVLLLIHRRLNYDSIAIVLLESLLIGGVVLMAWYLQARQLKQSSANATTSGPGSNMLPVALIAVSVIMPWIVDFVAKSMGFGNGVEIVMLSSLAWGGVCAALLARRVRTISLSVICSGFLTLFITFIADSTSAVWFAVVWAVVCLWWLISNQWEKMTTTSAVGIKPARMQRVMFLVLGLGTFLIGALTVSNRIPILRKPTAEIMPTSGGTSQKDSAARRGVGNGDAIIAAKKHATSFGAVDTDLFLESDKPSLFDLVSDELGEPKRTTKSERAQALDQKQVDTREQKYTESNRATGGLNEFAIDRQLPDERRPTDNLVSHSLMFWQGQPGALLAVKRFEHFDGVRWFNDGSVIHNIPIDPVEVEESIWFRAGRQAVHNSLNPYVDALPESLKFTRYSSAVIPTRVGMQLWSIDQIIEPSFFAIDNDDCLMMPGREQVPEYTVVRMVNSSIDLERVEQLVEGCAPGRSHRKRNDDCKAEINRLAHRFSGDHPRGWAQVQSIVAGVRNSFQLDRRVSLGSQSGGLNDGHDSEQPRLTSTSVATPGLISQDGSIELHTTSADGRNMDLPELETNALAQFLTEGRGPDYMFATAAALMLEHMGYRTRLVMGFYANPDHYLDREREYAIQPSDLHAWVEIDAGHEYWIPLEPSPGYLQPRYTASLWYYIRLYRWQIAQAATGTIAALLLLIALRPLLVEALSLFTWPLVRLLNDKQRIAWLARLIDLRSRLAGLPRSASSLPREHLQPAIKNLAEDQAKQVNIFLAAADRMWFGGLPTLNQEERLAISRLWLGLTSRVLKRSFSSRSKPEVS